MPQRASIFAALLASALIVECLENVEKDVLVLTDSNIASTLQEREYVMIEFYAPWCGHCQQLLPEYGAAATELSSYEPAVVLAKVDATTEKSAAEPYGIKGYPTLLWFETGEMQQKYDGPRTQSDIVRWIKKRVGPPADTLTTLQDLEILKSSAEVFLLGFFEEFKGSAFEAFQEAARSVEDYPVYQTTSAEVAAASGVTGSAPAFVVGTNFGAEYVGVSSRDHPAFEDTAPLKEQILSFLKTEQLPPFLEYSTATNGKVFSMDRQVFFIAPAESLMPGSNAIESIEAAHKAYKGKFAFATAALKTDPADMLVEFFSADKRGKDVQVIGFVPDAKKYKMAEPLNPTSLIAFCQGILDETYPRFYKSAPQPTVAKDGHVTIVVGRTFDSIVLDPKKDVLLLLYAPWSDKSKKVTPIWRKLARHLRSIDSLVIAKFDGAANEHEQITTIDYPSILFYPAQENAVPIPFKKEPSVKALLKFLKKHAVVPFDLSKLGKKDEDSKIEL